MCVGNCGMDLGLGLGAVCLSGTGCLNSIKLMQSVVVVVVVDLS